MKKDQIERIKINENRLDNLDKITKKLDTELAAYEIIINDYHLLNNYYGSKYWFEDKEDYEKSIINNVKAGVLSEDAVWNLKEETDELINKMESIIEKLKKEN